MFAVYTIEPGRESRRGQVDDVLRALDRQTHEFRGGTGAADGVDGASGAGMVQEDVAEDHNHQCDDHADVEGQIVGDLRIVDDLDHVGDEREVIACGKVSESVEMMEQDHGPGTSSTGSR